MTGEWLMHEGKAWRATCTVCDTITIGLPAAPVPDSCASCDLDLDTLALVDTRITVI